MKKIEIEIPDGPQFLELWAEAIAFDFSVGERLK